MNHYHQIKMSFNKACKTYDAHSELQQEIGSKLITLLKTLSPSVTKMIDLGCGTGVVTEKLAHAFHYHDFHAIDIADNFLKVAQPRLQALNINAYTYNFDRLIDMDQSFELVFSNMSLQWSQHLANTLTSIKNKLNNHGWIAFSIPLSGTLMELKHHYATQHFATLDDIKSMLINNSLDIYVSEYETISLNFPTFYHALKSIKLVGANYTGKRIHKGLRGKKWLHLPTKQSLTYVIGYFIARKV